MPRDLVTFLAAVRRSPARVGAIAPSSPRLAARLGSVVAGTGDPVVVELGPGTGSATTAITARLAGRGRHLAVEIDPVLVAHLRQRFPGVVVIEGDAARLPTLLAEHDANQVDAVVSGLPWSLLPEPAQRAIVTAAAATLAPGGSFTTFAYVHALPLRRARAFRALLDEVFDEVLTTRTVWRNVPPAVSYVCRRPR